MKYLILLLLLSTTISAKDRAFKEVIIPNAICADGSQYFVYFAKGDESKLNINLQRGGSCWDYTTCKGIFGRGATPRKITGITGTSVHLSVDKKINPFADYTVVYMPYCTGLTFNGTITKTYKKGKKSFTMHHVGHLNVIKTMNVITKKLVDMKKVKKFILSGSSAGAVGAILNATTIGYYIPKTVKKYLLADAPGLSWSKKFWNKFPDDTFRDMSLRFESVGGKLNKDDGHLFKQLDKIASFLKDWDIVVLQGSYDIVMTLFDLKLNPIQQHQRIYGIDGLFQKCVKADNCKAWIPLTMNHTFLRTSAIKSKKKNLRMTVREFLTKYIGE